MSKRWKKWSLALALVTILGLMGWGSLRATPTLAASEVVPAIPNLAVPLVATATAPPSLVPAILNGNPVHVLYVTRSEDTVLVRCYPGFEPALAVQEMGGSEANGGQKQGVLTCVSPAG